MDFGSITRPLPIAMKNNRAAGAYYGAAGSFKSKTIKILQALIDKDATCSVSPQDMDSDYDRSFLANKLLNVVPEIDENKQIASGSF